MKEFELISRLTRSLPANSSVLAGAGDDCAVLESGSPDRVLLFKTDAVVEGIHFARGTPPAKIGRKALARCLSDIAAMAGTPTAALVTIALPAEYQPDDIEGIYEGLSSLARAHGVAIVGGETTVNPERLLISVAVLGEAPRGKVILRSGAKPGDAIFVTGELGGSRCGKHLDFEPRLEEARWLAGHFSIHAMIDLSDGLAGDLRHILKAGQVGAELLASSIPISRKAKESSRKRIAGHGGEAPGRAGGPPGSRSDAVGGGSAPKSPLLAALTDGEDYELLFTVAGRDAVPLLDAWKAAFPKVRLACIGKITREPGISLRDAHGRRPLTVHGYEHFS